MVRFCAVDAGFKSQDPLVPAIFSVQVVAWSDDVVDIRAMV